MLLLFVLCILVSGIDACSTNSDCAANEECKNGSCQCVAGYEIINSACTKVLGKNCSLSSDCSMVANSECERGVCICDSNRNYYEANNVCESVIGRACTDEVQCLSEPYVSCRNSFCECDHGYERSGDSCIMSYCTNDTDCTDPNTSCNEYYFCECSDGYSLENGACTQDVGRACGGSSYCYSRTWCSNGRCECYDRYREENGVCVTYLGESCQTESDCGTDYRIHCHNGVCECLGSFIQDGDDCNSIIYSSCNSNADCPLEYSNCSNYYSWASSGSCICIDGAVLDYNDYYCKPEIGHSCSHYSVCSNAPTYCDANDMCTCGFGTVSSDDLLSCETVFDTSCTSTSDCKDEVMYKCESGLCKCSDTYMEYGYDPYWSYHIPCVKRIGRSCNETECVFDNAECNDDYECACIPGYMEDDGICIQGLGASCHHDVVCNKFDSNTRCDMDNTCKCKYGFMEVSGLCIAVLGSGCSTNSDCDSINNVYCTDDFVCRCQTGFVEYKSECVIESCVAENVSPLPNPLRRLKGYTSDFSHELALDDQQLEEKWYSLGDNLPLMDPAGLSKGDCGTVFPISIDSLTPEEISALDSVPTPIKAHVGGLDEFGSSEEFYVDLRKCENDVQLKLKRPSTPMAAYCLGGTFLLNSRPREMPTIKSELHFSSVPFNNSHTTFKPFLVFKCDLLPSYIWYGYRYNQYYGKYYIVNWYINNNHLVTYGPVKFGHLNDTNLHESTLVDYLIGFKVQCSYQQMDKLTGYVSMPKFSQILDTNIKTRLKTTVYHSTSSPRQYISPELQVPLGCLSTDGINLCQYKFRATGSDDSCAMSTNEHEICGFVVNATTYEGSFEQLSEYSWEMMAYEFSSFDIYEDETGQRVKEYIRSNLTLPSNFAQLHDYRPFKFEAQTNGLDTGHAIWQGYRIADLMIYPYPYYGIGQRVSFQYGYSIYWDNWASSVHVPDIQAGVYILYRSNHFPIEIQFKLQNGGTGSVEVCGVAIRRGNMVRIESFCDQANITALTGGDLPWDEESIWEKKMYFDDGLFFGLNVGAYVQDGSIYSLTFEGFENVFRNAEGAATISEGFNKRDGTVTTSALEFITSWKITTFESLWNPQNHKSFSYIKEFYLCECPDSTTDTSDRVVDNGYETEIQYNGIIQCTLDYPCEEEISGNNEWLSSLLPDYVVEEINVFVEGYFMGDSGDIPQLKFRCNFTTVIGYYYKVFWGVDGKTVMETDIMDDVYFEDYGLLDGQLLNEAKNLYLNSEIVCGASVYSSQNDSDLLLGYKNSSAFIPVQMDSDRFYLQRAGRVSYRLRMNIPLLCFTCNAKLKVLDPLDTTNTCRYSSIAVVSNSMCGQILTRTTSPVTDPESVDIDLTLTTIYAGTYNPRTFYNLTLAIETDGITTSIWGRPFNRTLLGYITDNNNFWQGRRCYMNNDPRGRTIDGIYFLLGSIGQFVLMRHMTLDIQIQVETFACGGWRAVCSCGVTFQAGLDVLTINHCNGNHYAGFLFNDTKKLIEWNSIGQNRHQVFLPSGTKAEVRVSPWAKYLVNIDIFPSLTDVGNMEGLCGNYDGDSSNDFKHRDGTIETTNRWSYYSNAADFIESWRVSENESLSNPLINETLESWSEPEDMKCVCPQSSGTNRLVCGINEKTICYQTTNAQETSINNSIRRKRSVARREELYRKLNTKQPQPDIGKIVKRSADVNYTLDEARKICNDSLAFECGQFRLSEALNSTSGINTTQFVEECALDLQLSPDVDWAGEVCGTVTVVADVELSMDEIFQQQNPELFQQFTALKCPGKSNCSGNGLCSNGVCLCLDGYGSEDCYLLLAIPPFIQSIEGDGTCDTNSEDNCHCMILTTNGTSSETATCNITVAEIGQNGTTEDETTYSVNVTSFNFNEVECCVPNDARRKRSTDSASIAQVVYVALSNDGQSFGNPVQMYVLDTTCQQTSNDSQGNTVVVLKSGYCYIDGVCIQNNTKLSNESCLVCMPDSDAFGWTEDGCPNATTVAQSVDNNNSGDDDSDSLTLIIVLISVFSCALCVGVGVLIYLAYKHSKKLNRLGPQTRLSTPMYFDETPNRHFHGSVGSRKFAYE